MTVYLVGAGPGDPGLITVKGAQLLAIADAVVYDRLANDELLAAVPDGAERYDVGKSRGDARRSQPEINELLVELGQRLDTVVRLKGGDPFLFARGGEEMAHLAAHAVSFEIVPGVTSAIAAPAYAGVPVTLRETSPSVTIVTGHEDPDDDEAQVNWADIARVPGTIVILMGASRIGQIARELLDAGRSSDTPVMAVRWGTRPEQEARHLTLGELVDTTLAAPCTVVIGDVARSPIPWFEPR